MKQIIKSTVFLITVVLLSQCEKKLEKDVIINIPDKNFLAALKETGYVDDNWDGIITQSEASDVRTLEIWGKEILDLTGIEEFVSLVNLDCSDNYLNELDLSSNTELEYLRCSGNFLNKNLNIINCTQLKKLVCAAARLEELDVTKNTQLEYLNCGSNEIKNLDLSNNPYLQYLYIHDNSINELDLSNNINLRELNCDVYEAFNLSANQMLEDLAIRDGALYFTQLDLSQNYMLKRLALYDTWTLEKVCVWCEPFPPEGLLLEIYPPKNITFTTECSN